MEDLRSMPNFEFYADLYPIIRDPGWQIGHKSYGSVNYLCHRPLTEVTDRDDVCYRGYMVGIVVGPNWWRYCYKAIGFAHMYGDRLDIPNSAPPYQVYEAARLKALEYFAEYDTECDAEFAREGQS